MCCVAKPSAYNSKKLQFRSKRCVFLEYSNLHKGFKCLDPSEGRVYISRDVVFDERVFPFSQMHPNAGARLRAELSLLPDILKNPSSSFGDATLRDQTLTNSLPTNVSPSSRGAQDFSGTNPDENGAQIASGRPHFMNLGQNDKTGAGFELDPPAPGTDLSGHLLRDWCRLLCLRSCRVRTPAPTRSL